MFTPFAEAICNLAVHLYRAGCCFDYTALQAGVYAEAYCDSFGYCIPPPDYAQVFRKEEYAQPKDPSASGERVNAAAPKTSSEEGTEAAPASAAAGQVAPAASGAAAGSSEGWSGVSATAASASASGTAAAGASGGAVAQDGAAAGEAARQAAEEDAEEAARAAAKEEAKRVAAESYAEVQEIYTRGHYCNEWWGFAAHDFCLRPCSSLRTTGRSRHGGATFARCRRSGSMG